MVLFVLCFGVDFLCCLNLMYVFIFQVTKWAPIGKQMLTRLMFSKYNYLIVNLVFPISVFGVGISF